MTDDLRTVPPDDYLWDRSGPIDPEVEALERSLGTLKFNPAQHPLTLPARRGLRAGAWLALAAALVAAAGAGAFWWRLQWPADRGWRLATITTSGDQRISTLAVGQTIDLANAKEASLSIARLGAARVHPGSDVSLRATSSRRHSLHMTRGTIDVRVWAPPMRVVIGTPAGTVIDMGCVFTLTVDAGVASVRVDTGWVQLENKFGETLAPAGTSSGMTGDAAPGVPVYDDATAEFRDAVRLIEGGTTPKIDFALTMIDRDARARDVPTLLMLALRSPQMLREALLARAAVLVPPPAPVGKMMDLPDEAIWRWFDTLPLPPAKAWWLNWRDLFRR